MVHKLCKNISPILKKQLTNFANLRRFSCLKLYENNPGNRQNMPEILFGMNPNK